MKKKYSSVVECDKDLIIAIRDTLNVVSGKWKLGIVGVLFSGRKRFSEIQRTVTGISPRMLSKELRELEVNGVISRTVITAAPVTIEYELTPSGWLLDEVIMKMVEWGLQHRETTMVS